MRSDVSRTARYMALFRALETCRQEDRLFADPFAERCLPLHLRAVVLCARSGWAGRWIERSIDARWPGVWSSAVARTRLIDGWTTDAVKAGARQVVLLGAGYDCRAHRLPALSAVPVFEVDRPSLLARKRRRLERTGPARRVEVPVDFRRDELARKLAAAGFGPGEPSLFVWEGVTNYLDARAVASVFELIARVAAPGSRIGFTYVHADVLVGRFPAPGLDALFAKLEASGEPWTFGFRPDEVPGYLEQHGLRLIADMGAADYRSAVMGERARGLVGYEFYRAALAEVVDRERGHAEDQ